MEIQSEHAPYFYISYYDTKAVTYAVAYSDALPTSSYLRNYQYDELGLVKSVGSAVPSTVCWGANVFTAVADEDLAAVGFYALSENTDYTITVYDTIGRMGHSASFTDPLISVSGTARWYGYHTVVLPSTVALTEGDDFAIVVRFSTPDTNRPVPLELPVEGYSSAASANAGEGYITTNGQSFRDITTYEGYEEVSICIKGLTIMPGSRLPLPADLEAVTDAQYASLEGLAPGSEEAQVSQRQAIQELGLPLEVKARQIGIVFRLVPSGSFTMGSPLSESDRFSDEVQHEVALTKPFYCGKYEITQAQWQQVMGSNPSYFKDAGPNAPVDNASWSDCQTFVRRVCQMERVPEGTYRLLTEAEWEYSCRAGTQTAFCYGNDLDAAMANFDGTHPYGNGNIGEYRQRPMPVGSFQPNAWGLYDMHGNVWEACQDWCGPYASGLVVDPVGPVSGTFRVGRGASWAWPGRGTRSAYRGCGSTADDRWSDVGLRIARSLIAEPSN